MLQLKLMKENNFLISLHLSFIFVFLCTSTIETKKKINYPNFQEQYHEPEGCISYKELWKYFRNLPIKSKAHKPKWCSDTMIPPYLAGIPPAKTPLPFTITTFEFTNSNAVNVSIKGQNNNYIADLYVTTRSLNLDNHALGRYVGRFVPALDTSIVCCNLVNRNGVHVNILKTERIGKATITWLPDGDYEGPFCFLITVVNNFGEYWSGVRSETIMAKY